MSEGIHRYSEAWRRAWAADAGERRERASRARDRLPAIIDVLVTEWGARRIWLIGSLLSDRFDLHSDIDLVAEGLDRQRFFYACAAADRAAGEFSVDLVPLESARRFVIDLIDGGEARLVRDVPIDA